MCELKKRIEQYKPKHSKKFWGAYSDGVRDGCDFSIKLLDEAKKDLLNQTLSSKLIDLGDYILLHKPTFEKWFGR